MFHVTEQAAYHWTVTVKDEKGGTWESEENTFETALMDFSDVEVKNPGQFSDAVALFGKDTGAPGRKCIHADFIFY